MTISNETVINKMMEEIQAAKESVDYHSVMIDHISKIKLLSELILDEYEGKNKTEKSPELTNKKPLETIYTDEKLSDSIQEDGTSIFDF